MTTTLGVFDSKILPDGRHKKLLNLCEFPAGQKWNLLYRASEHGFSADDFHSKCDNHANTLTVIKTTNGNIFGGYTEQLWNHTIGYKTDKNAFIFSLVNIDRNPIKMKIKTPHYAIWCDVSYGPFFGHYDICILGGSNSNQNSLSDLGRSYQHPTYAQGTNEAKCFLAGSRNFRVSEIEVFNES
jgi:hypothetical protein